MLFYHIYNREIPGFIHWINGIFIGCYKYPLCDFHSVKKNNDNDVTLYMAEILPIRRKTLYNKSINQYFL